MTARVANFIFVSLVAFLLSCGIARAQLAATEQAALSGPWRGEWTAPEGWIYEAVMTLRPADSGAVSGQISWTLRKSPRANEAAKIGLGGVEMVRGTFYRDSGTLIIEGYEKNDPHGVLGLDKYRLVMSGNRKVLGGLTAHHERWNSRFFLVRD